MKSIAGLVSRGSLLESPSRFTFWTKQSTTFFPFIPNAQAIRARFPFLPLPVFTFESWLTSLAIGIALFFCLSPFAFRGMRWTRVAALPVSIVVGVLNGAGHILASVYYHRWMPGVYSSPPLLLAAIFLMATARSHRTNAAKAASAHESGF